MSWMQNYIHLSKHTDIKIASKEALKEVIFETHKRKVQ